MKKAILVHGIKVYWPERSIGKLDKYFKDRGFDTHIMRYGYIGPLGARQKNIDLAEKLAKQVVKARQEGYQVFVVAHSNGVTITHIAATKFKAPISMAVCINPALDKRLHPCPTASVVHVYHNAKDLPVRLAKWLRWFTPLARKARPWGEMGNVGYQGNNKHVCNFDTLNDFEVIASGHSGVFDEIKFYGPLIPYVALRDYAQRWGLANRGF